MTFGSLQLAAPLALQVNEDLIWLVFLVLWGLYSLFFGRKKSTGDNAPPVIEEDDSEAQRRAREIQEEIRRRIQERARNWKTPEDKPAEPAPQRSEPPPLIPQQPRRAPERRVEPAAPATPIQTSGGAEWTEKLAQARRLQRESEDKVAASLRQVASARRPRREAVEVVESTPDRTFSLQPAALAAHLRSNREAARAAIVLSEILGKPVSEKEPRMW